VLDHGSAYLSLGNPLGDAALRVWEHALTAAGRRYHPSYAGVSRASAQWPSTFHVTCEHLIPDAIDAPAFRTRRSSRDFRAELGLGADTYLISFVGRLEPIKGGLSLARALTLLPKDYACVIAGEGSEYQPIAELGCNRVHLVGNLSPADVSALHASSDVFCLPSRSEGFCLAYLEASAWGLPSVMPDVGVVSEVMGAGDFGRIVTDCEPTTLATALREVAERFDHRHLSDLIDLIERRYSWEASATAVEACFGDASSAD
jgi:glycosyltransferase involved in cell wall biosynthesis